MKFDTKPVWVADQHSLKSLVADLAAQPIIAVDTESNSLFVYFEQVCLIQFSTPQRDYLVDPLAIEDLTPLGVIFSDPAKEKVFHAAEYDLICLQRDFGFQFSNIFDTMIGARTLGWRQTGLGNLLKEHFDISVNKKYQRANWGKRPLDPEQLDYARADTHYLIALRHIIHDQLVETNRWDLAREQFRHAAVVTIPNNNDPILSCWRSCKQRDFDEQQNTVLYELCRYREEFAQRIDRPPFKVLSKENLVSVARACPTNMGELRSQTNLSGRNYDRHAAGLLHAVKQGLNRLPFRDQRRRHTYDEVFQNNLEALREWRKQQAQALNVESDVILDRETMEKIAHSNPASPEILQALLKKMPERWEQFGDDIFAVLSATQAKYNHHKGVR
jgi:ribonuclease D